MTDFNKFFEENFIITNDKNDTVKSIDIGKIYANKNKTGKNKFFEYIRNDLNIKFKSKVYSGLKIKQVANIATVANIANVANAEQVATVEVIEQVANVDANVAVTPVIEPTNQMTEYQRQKLLNKEKELKLQAEQMALQDKQVKEQLKLQDKELTLQDKQVTLQDKQATEELNFKREKFEKRIEHEEKMLEKTLEFKREKNNKIRPLYIMYNGVNPNVDSRFNQHLDFRAFGSPSEQYIEAESLIDNINFGLFDATNHVIPELYDSVKSKVNECKEEVDVVVENTEKTKNLISLENSKQLITEFYNSKHDIIKKAVTKSKNSNDQSMNNVVTSLKTLETEIIERMNDIIDVAERNAEYETRYVKDLKQQNPEKYKTKLSKDKYLVPINDAKYVNNKRVCNCYKCNAQMILDDNNCHRGHNIPKSKGGDLSTQNIRNICSKCNLNMSDDYTILESKVMYFIELVKSIFKDDKDVKNEDDKDN